MKVFFEGGTIPNLLALNPKFGHYTSLSSGQLTTVWAIIFAGKHENQRLWESTLSDPRIPEHLTCEEV